jgi:hypothetical protein
VLPAGGAVGCSDGATHWNPAMAGVENTAILIKKTTTPKILKEGFVSKKNRSGMMIVSSEEYFLQGHWWDSPSESAS